MNSLCNIRGSSSSDEDSHQTFWNDSSTEKKVHESATKVVHSTKEFEDSSSEGYQTPPLCLSRTSRSSSGSFSFDEVSSSEDSDEEDLGFSMARMRKSEVITDGEKGVGLCEYESLEDTYKRVSEMNSSTAAMEYSDGKTYTNFNKNRYGNIFPFNKNRYQMKSSSFKAFVPYINASEMFTGDIITQGPKKETQRDFWMMVWDSGSKVIINGTELIEKSVEKCALYWPKEGKLRSFLKGKFKVELIKKKRVSVVYTDDGEKKKALINYRTIQMTYNGKTREVTLIRLRHWNDFGVYPSVAILKVIKEITEMDGTAIFHCSGGVGRAGTLYACYLIYQIVKVYKKSGEAIMIDPAALMKLIRNKRSGRMMLIQTVEQFKLVFTFAEHLIATTEKSKG